jgi:outer membrane immunogenic protein
MKLVLASMAIAALTMGSAVAADMPIKGPRAVAPACAQFGGYYLGVHGGWGYYRHDHSDRGNLVQTIDDDLPTNTVQADGNGFGGAQIGRNWQSNCTVFGLEADWSWSGMRAQETFLDGDGATQDSLTVSSKLRWFGTVRTRTGIVVDNLLLYVTGGFAYARFNRDYTIVEDAPLTTFTFSSTNTRWGWTAGFGTEWAWSGNWSIKSEVLYMRFVGGDAGFTGTTFNTVNFGVPGRGYNFGSQDEVWVARIGLNYRFGGN